jgi:hypothetical protein
MQKRKLRPESFKKDAVRRVMADGTERDAMGRAGTWAGAIGGQQRREPTRAPLRRYLMSVALETPAARKLR